MSQHNDLQVFRGRMKNLSDRVTKLERGATETRPAARFTTHTETKTFIVGGDLAVGLFIPWVFLGFNIDAKSQERKYLIGLAGRVRVGSLEVNWELDDVEIYSGHIIDTSGLSDVLLTDPVELTPGWHVLRTVIQSGTATDFSGAYATVTSRR